MNSFPSLFAIPSFSVNDICTFQPTWRPIHFRYGNNKPISVSLELLNSYELIHDGLLDDKGQTQVVPVERAVNGVGLAWPARRSVFTARRYRTQICNQVLEICSSDDEIDSANQAAILEVRTSRPLVKVPASTKYILRSISLGRCGREYIISFVFAGALIHLHR